MFSFARSSLSFFFLFVSLLFVFSNPPFVHPHFSFFFPSPHLLCSLLSVFIKKKIGREVYYPCPVIAQGWGGQAAIGQPPHGRPQSLFPPYFCLVVGHGSEFRQVGGFVGFVFVF
jgi:hypothetical protein